METALQSISGELISQKCSYFLTIDNAQQIISYQYLIGWGINRLGSYYDCLANHSNSYFLLYADIINTNTNFASGFCFSSNCTASDVKYIFQTLQQYVTLPGKLDNVIEPIAYQVDFSVLAIVMLSIISVLILAVIMATFMDARELKAKSLPVRMFSLRSTLGLITVREEKLKVMSVIKFLSFLGIMVSHQFTLILNASSAHLSTPSHSLLPLLYVFAYSIEMWFCMSGFFLGYMCLREFYSNNRKYRVLPLHLLKHWIQVYPIYVIGIILTSSIVPVIGSGPLYPLIIEYLNTHCAEAGVLDYLMIGNLFDVYCNPWNYYFECEIQLFLLFLFIMFVYLLYRQKAQKNYYLAFVVIQILLFLASMAIGFALNLNNESTISKYVRSIQHGWRSNPIVHVGPYILGFNFGIFYYQFKHQSKAEIHNFIQKFKGRPKKILAYTPPLILFLGIQTYFFFQPTQKMDFADKLFLQFCRTLIPLNMLAFLFRQLIGFQTPLKDLFSNKIFIVLSRITPSLFIVHYSVQVWRLFSQSTDIYMNPFSVIFNGICNMSITLVAGLVVALTVQVPMTTLKNSLLQ